MFSMYFPANNTGMLPEWMAAEKKAFPLEKRGFQTSGNKILAHVVLLEWPDLNKYTLFLMKGMHQFTLFSLSSLFTALLRCRRSL